MEDQIKENFNIYLWNARSIKSSKKFASFKANLKRVRANIDVIVLTETWIMDTDVSPKFDYYSLKGYNHIYLTRDRCGGGVSIYIKEKIQTRSCVTCLRKDFEKIKIFINVNDKWTKLCAYYRPPREPMSGFLQDLEAELDTPDDVLIMGDMNVDVSADPSSNYLSLLKQYNAEIINTSITREASSTIIDHVITKPKPVGESTQPVISTVNSSMSDHRIILTSIPTNAKPANVVKDGMRVIDRKIIDYDKLYDSFEIDCTLLAEMNDVNKEMDFLYEEISKASTAATSHMQFKLKAQNCEDVAPWTSIEVLKLLKWKDNISNKINKLRRKNLPHNKLDERLHKIEDKLAFAVSSATENYYERAFQAADNRKSWKLINELMGKKSATKRIELMSDDNVINDDSRVAIMFSNHFKAISESIKGKFTCKTLYNKYNTLSAVDRSIEINPVDDETVHKLLNELDTNKSTGIDEVNAKILKSLGDKIIPALVIIINCMLDTGVYPERLKVALIKPVLKAGDKFDVKNYRPISILPILNKIFEKALLFRLKGFLSEEGVTDPYQFGFREGSATDLALYELSHHINSALNDGFWTGVLFLDVTKAFDSLSHEVFTSKLNELGIRDKANDLISNYFTRRLHAVKINGAVSDFEEAGVGIGQGSNLGPFFYNVYLDDFKRLELKGKSFRFADDICILFRTQKDRLDEFYECLKHDFGIVSEYHRAHGMEINPSKSKFMVFRSSFHKNAQILDKVELGNECYVPRVSVHKYLGYYFDEHMTHESHISNLVKKCTPVVNILSRLKWTTSTKILTRIYFANIHSHLSYVPFLYGAASDEMIKRLQTLQNRALRHVHKLKYDFNTERLFKEYAKNVLPVKGMLCLSSCLILHKMRCGIITSNIPLSINDNGLRSDGKFCIGNFKLRCLKFDLSRRGAKIYNNIPSNVTSILIVDNFKYRLKRILLGKSNELLNVSGSLLTELRLD